MKALCVSVSKDIKSCHNACQTYAQKHSVVKLCTGIFWKNKFAGFVEAFVKWKQELLFGMIWFSTIQQAEARAELYERKDRDKEEANESLSGRKYVPIRRG